MKELNSRLKSGKIDSVYIFWGAERYLTLAYEKRLRSALLGDGANMNAALFEGGASKTADIIMALETLPFQGGRRLITLKNTGLMQTGKKDESEALANYLPDIPDSSSLLFLETEKAPDKRGKLYKKASAAGLEVEFKTPSESELSSWLIRLLKSEGLDLAPDAARFILRYSGGSSEYLMDRLYLESRKLASYARGQGRVTAADAAAVCVQSIEGRIFALVKEMGSRDISALTSYSNLLALKEQPLSILSMITRQFRLMLLSSGLRKKGLAAKDIAAQTGLRDFMVSDFLKQSANFTPQTISRALSDCLDAETNIKSGKMNDKLAVELLIVKYCSKKI